MNTMPLTRLSSLAVVLALTLPSPGSADEDAAAGLIDRLHAFLDGASRNDAAVHDRFWAEDLVYTSSAGERFGKAEIMQGLADAPAVDAAALPRYRGEDVHVEFERDFAVVTFRLVADLPDGARAQYFNTGVFRRSDGQWRAFAWQATRIPDDAGDE
jgi:hypothetical protein